VISFLLFVGLASMAVCDEFLGLPEMKFSEDNPPTPEKIALGEQLFFDP